MCVKKTSGSFTFSRICGHAGLWQQLRKHLQHSTLGEVWKLRRAPGDSVQAGTPEPVCFDLSHPQNTLYIRNKQ